MILNNHTLIVVIRKNRNNHLYHVSHVFLGHIHAYSTATYNGVNYTVSGGGGAGLHNRYGPLGNVHHYVICDVLPDGTLKQQVVRFFKEDK